MPTSRLHLPFLAAAQAQKHVTVNEALLRLDALVQIVAVSRSMTSQPASPTDGALYILPAGKTGADWGAMANGALAYYRDGVWEQISPLAGFLAFVSDEGLHLFWTGAGWAGLASTIGALPPAHLSGLTLGNNASDAANDIDIAPGQARADDNGADLALASALTKRLDASWAVGTNQGGLDAGSKAASTWCHLYLIKRLDTGVVDALFSTSATAPTMPSGYTKKRRLGAVRTDGSGNIRAFTQTGDEFLFTTPVQDVDTTSLGTSATNFTLTVPPKTLALISAVAGSSGLNGLIIRPTFQADVAPSALSGNCGLVWHGSEYAAGNFEVRVDGASQLSARSTTSGTQLYAATRGWVDVL